jgi:hypothetical protein
MTPDLPSPTIPLPYVLQLVDGMLEEAQREARHSLIVDDVLMLLAKRDALSELAKRLRGNRADFNWARMRPGKP